MPSPVTPKGKTKTARTAKTANTSEVKHPNWETMSKNVKLKHNGRTYALIEIPEGTYLYSGFCSGDPVYPSDTKQDREETEQMNVLEYEKKRANRLYYGSLGVALYYTNDPDRCKGKRKYTVQEYKTNQTIRFLDMNVWENLKYVVDDIGENVFASTHGFDPDHKKALERFPGDDNDMIEKMVEWLARESSPQIDGFGSKKVKAMLEGRKTSFHAEIACIHPSLLSLTNEYASDTYNAKKYVNIQDATDSVPFVKMPGGAKRKTRKKQKV